MTVWKVHGSGAVDGEDTFCQSGSHCDPEVPEEALLMRAYLSAGCPLSQMSLDISVSTMEPSSLSCSDKPSARDDLADCPGPAL